MYNQFVLCKTKSEYRSRFFLHFPGRFFLSRSQACSVVHRFDALSIPLFARARKTPSPAAAAAHNTRRSTTDLTSPELAGIDRRRDRCCPVFPLTTHRGGGLYRKHRRKHPWLATADATTDRDRQSPFEEKITETHRFSSRSLIDLHAMPISAPSFRTNPVNWPFEGNHKVSSRRDYDNLLFDDGSASFFD